jgi:hypothetical protein
MRLFYYLEFQHVDFCKVFTTADSSSGVLHWNTIVMVRWQAREVYTARFDGTRQPELCRGSKGAPSRKETESKKSNT